MGTYGPLFADRVLHKGLDGFGSILFAAGPVPWQAEYYLPHPAHIIHSGSYLLQPAYAAFSLWPSATFSDNPSAFHVRPARFCYHSLHGKLQYGNPDGISPEYLGRIMGLYTFVFLGSAPFGSLLVSAIIEYMGTSLGLAIVGLLKSYLYCSQQKLIPSKNKRGCDKIH